MYFFKVIFGRTAEKISGGILKGIPGDISKKNPGAIGKRIFAGITTANPGGISQSILRGTLGGIGRIFRRYFFEKKNELLRKPLADIKKKIFSILNEFLEIFLRKFLKKISECILGKITKTITEETFVDISSIIPVKILAGIFYGISGQFKKESQKNFLPVYHGKFFSATLGATSTELIEQL